eukprot:6192498-Pleurochrysis_carterae.AAC.1
MPHVCAASRHPVLHASSRGNADTDANRRACVVLLPVSDLEIRQLRVERAPRPFHLASRRRVGVGPGVQAGAAVQNRVRPSCGRGRVGSARKHLHLNAWSLGRPKEHAKEHAAR